MLKYCDACEKTTNHTITFLHSYAIRIKCSECGKVNEEQNMNAFLSG
jgi:ribosomal protein S27E